MARHMLAIKVLLNADADAEEALTKALTELYNRSEAGEFEDFEIEIQEANITSSK